MSDDFGRLKGSEVDQIMKWADEIASDAGREEIKLDFKEDGVYLTVYPQKGSSLNHEDIVRDIVARKIQNVEFAKVRQVVREMKGEPVRIAPPQHEQMEDGSVRVELSKNKMEAYLIVTPPKGGTPVTREMIDRALQEANVVYGIKEDVIERALMMPQSGEPLTVAEGVPPVDGENAVIEYRFVVDTVKAKPTEMIDGRVDYYNLNLIQNVEEGAVLAVKTPPTPGTPGYTVTGEEIPPKPGKDVQISIGKNVELRDDNSTAVATARGHVVLVGNKISVSNVYEVSGDVDFNTGNIEFNGSVIVKGSIREGFRVTADGDVEVMNTISDGMVECTGSLRVRNGIVGKKAKIRAGGSVATRFIENAVVEAGGDVTVGEAIMHSRVSAGKSVAVGGKGVIVGGVIRAGEEINCKIIGSPLATATEIEAGINPELRREHSRLVKEKQAKEADFEKADKAVKLLNYLQQTQGQLPPDKQAILIRVSKVQAQLAGELRELAEAVRTLEQQIEQSERGRVLVQGVIHSGVKVTIGSAYMQVQDDYTFVCLTKSGVDIKISPYK